MSIYLDPETQQRIVYDPYCGDIVYDKSGDSAITKETIPVIGKWEDYTGSDTNITTKQLMYGGGASNQLQGTVPGLMGEKVPDLGEVGQNKQTTRRRTKKVLVNVNKN